MWIDRAKEAKKRLNMSNRDISIATKGKLSERDVTKLLKGEYKRASFDDVIEVANALHLSLIDLLAETNTVLENAVAVEETSNIRKENEKLNTDVEMLNAKIECLEREISHLNALLSVKDELLSAKDELLATFRAPKALTFH